MKIFVFGDKMEVFFLLFVISVPSSLLNVFALTSNEICLNEICAKKCCPEGEIWNSVAIVCQTRDKAWVLQPSDKLQKTSLRNRTSFVCPEGKKLSYVNTSKIASFDPIIDCIEDALINDNVPKVVRKAFKCTDQLQNDSSIIAETTESLKIDPSRKKTNLEKIPLIKCCLGSDSFYSIGNQNCQQESDQVHQWPPPIYSEDGNWTLNVTDEDFHLKHRLMECEEGFVSQRTTDFRLYQNGSMITKGFANNTDLHRPEEFCIEDLISHEKKHELDFAAHFCVPDICNTTVCVRKCCPIGYGISEELHSCQPLDIPFVPKFHNENNTVIVSEENYVLRAGMFPRCPHGIAPLEPEVYPEDIFYLQASGDLYFPSYSENEKLVSEYCIDNFFTINHSSISSKVKGLNCFPPQLETPEDVIAVLTVFPYLLFVSSLFLLATFLVYAFIPELRNLHGITIMCYVSSLAVTYICLGVIQIDDKLTNGPCIGIAVSIHFTFLAAFAWLSVLSFDIWFTLSCLPSHPESIGYWLDIMVGTNQLATGFGRPLSSSPSSSRSPSPQRREPRSATTIDGQINERISFPSNSFEPDHSGNNQAINPCDAVSDDENSQCSAGDTRARSTRSTRVASSRRFVMYSIYAWGIPFIIVATGQILDNMTNLPSFIIKPNFGHNKCWFHDNSSLLVYLYIPIAILLAGDIVFFIMTTIRLYLVSKDSAFATRNRHTKQKLRVIFSLFILMGISWTTEVVSFAVGGPAYYWIPTDVLNILTGVFIFIIFVCKKKVLRLFRKRCRHIEKCIACFGRGSVDLDNQSQCTRSTRTSDTRRKISMTTMTHISVPNSHSDVDAAFDDNEHK